MSSAERYLPHYTLADYQQWPGDWELLKGIPIAMTPSPFGPHQRLAHLLAYVLENAIRTANCKAVVLHETDWIVSDDTVVRADVVVICGAAPEKHIESPPAVVAEVLSASTRERDLTIKKTIYQNQGVQYYLVIDPESQSLELFRNTRGLEFVLLPFENALKIEICDGCQLKLELAEIFRN